MLNQNTLMSALALAERLEGQRQALYPVSGSPLAALVTATRSDPALLDASGGNNEVFVAKVAMMANKVQEVFGGVSHHNATMDEVAGNVITHVRNHLNFAKTVVVPVVNDLYTRVKASLAEIDASALLGMEVDVMCEPAPLENPQFQASIRKFEDMHIEDLPLTLNLPDQSDDELRELVSTGSAQIDASIAEWLSKDDMLLRYIWTHVFQQKPVEQPKSFLGLITDRQYGVQNALAIFLFARKLTDSKPLPGTQMGLNSYKQQIVDFRNQAAGQLSRALDKIERSIKNGILVRDVIGGTKTVVYDPLYRKFLESGGTNEMLFANALRGKSFLVSLSDLTNEKQALGEKWALHAGLVKTAEANKRFNKTKDFIELHFNSQLQELAANEDGLENNLATVRRLFENVLAGIRSTDVDDLWTLCLKVVCRARFWKTDAEQILLGMEQAKRENPSLSVREAATISTINYVADWVAGMMRVTPI
jgi:hypothetical protein